MKTDKLFYALFQQSPAVALTLLPDLPIDAVYDFSAPVVKESEFRLDGLLTPEDPNLPLAFIEARCSRIRGSTSATFPKSFSTCATLLRRGRGEACCFSSNGA